MRLRHLLPLLLACSVSAFAQSVRWQPAGGSIARGQVAELALIFDNCEPSGDITLPNIANLELGAASRGEQSSTNIINGRVERNSIVYFTYPARPIGDDPIAIPPFTVATDKGSMTVPGVRFEVREATIGNSAIPVSSVANSTLKVGNGQLWAGEVAPVNYTLSVATRYTRSLAGEPSWTPDPLVVEAWDKPTQTNLGTGADARVNITYATRGYLRTPGTYTIPSILQGVNIGVPTAGLFGSLRSEQYAITSDSPPVVVRPLPSPAPAGFTGAVGAFKLTSKVVPETAAVGEPVTWTLSLEGTGNWPDISGLPPRDVSRSFRVVQPQANRTLTEGKLFEGTINEDVVLIPTQPGTFKLGPVHLAYFDPQSGRYQTLTTPETALTITPAAVSAPPLPSASPAAGSDSTTPPATTSLDSAPIHATPAPVAPTAIPRDPLPGSASAPKPVAIRQIVLAAAALAALFPLLWLVLSWSHARRTDRGRPARIAKHQLRSVLLRLRTASDRAQRDELLQQWQHHTAVLWRTPHAAPSARLLRGDETWSALWRESERALYGEIGDLPPNWTDRATSALAAKRAPSFPIFSTFAWRNLFPAIVIAAALFTAVPTTFAVETTSPSPAPTPTSTSTSTSAPTESYANGKFDLAESAWRETLAAAPTDWIAHHNLALALAQQNRWDEAGSHAAIAFVQHPRDPSVRWHLGYALERAGYTPPVIGRFISPGWREQIAQLASPAEWQRIILAAALLGILSLALILFHAYGLRLPAWKLWVWLGGLVSVFALITAVLSLQTYGLTADAHAVLTWRATQLRSIPTDLNTSQQSTALAAGSLAREQKSFLGWRQLEFPNGQTGWVRHEEIVPIWSATK